MSFQIQYVRVHQAIKTIAIKKKIIYAMADYSINIPQVSREEQ